MKHVEDRITLADLERLISYSPLIGEKLISLAPIRARQDARLVTRIRRKALALIGDEAQITLDEPSFFVGSVDFMVRLNEETGRLNYVVLETNGGSSRGLVCLSPRDIEQICGGYQEMLDFIDSGDSKSPLIVIGCPKGDKLLADKIYIAQRLKEALLEKGLCEKAQVVPLEGFRGRLEKGEGAVVIGPYDRLVPSLHCLDGQVFLIGHRVSAIIGDGVARRHYLISTGQEMDVILANWTFPITDDKYMTYRATQAAMDQLRPFDVYSMRFWRARTIDELESICQEKRQEVGDLVIKPFQGSGGAGVLPVLADSHIPAVIEESLGEFREKFSVWQRPFPYTICEKITPRYAIWRDSMRNYDIRIYVARQNNQLIPLAGLFRLALQPYTGQFTKRALVVNLSGYGRVDVERGLGISKKALDIVRLTEEDMVKMFAASVVLLTFIGRHYKEILAQASESA